MSYSTVSLSRLRVQGLLLVVDGRPNSEGLVADAGRVWGQDMRWQLQCNARLGGMYNAWGYQRQQPTI
jgi:hypothetical protein